MRTDRFSLMLRSFALFLIAFLMTGMSALAQPNLNFKRVTVNWPTIELYFLAGCSGNPIYKMMKQDFKIIEDGFEVKDFTLWCPDTTLRCAISVSLVFDVSGSMAGSGNAGAKAAGHAFIDLMDGAIDEATIVAFNNQVTVLQQMTTSKPMLHTAVDALGANGIASVWNGIYAGIEELVNNGVNQCRAVIVLTDGSDDSSNRTPTEIISLAERNHTRVFTVGLGSSIDATELQQIASVTGGKYYQTPNAGQLAAIYAEISTIIQQGFQECIITYDRSCADSSLRTVNLQLVNFCGGTDSKTKTYRVPLDSTTMSDLHMKLGEARCRCNEDVTIPLNLLTPISPESMFYPLTFTLLYDELCIQFKGVRTPPGSILEGVPLDVTPVLGGARIRIADGVLVRGNGLLMEFDFRASNPVDTTCCMIEAIDVAFDEGCFIPIIEAGEICIFPPAPEISCGIDGPQELYWLRTMMDYTPNPFAVKGGFFNIGERDGKNSRFKITYDTTVIQLMTPPGDVQVGTPPDLPPGEYSEAIWQIAAKHRTTGDSTAICITGSFDNHEDIECCHKIWIPPIGPILECEMIVPSISADTVNNKYSPMPFPVTVTVHNPGGMPTDAIFATIIVPPDLALAGMDAPDNHTKQISPSILNPGDSGTVSWMVSHPFTMAEKEYTITAWVKSQYDFTDSTLCEVVVNIPPIDTTFLSVSITAGGPLTFCEGDSVILDAGDFYSYQWSTGDLSRTITVTTSGDYSVTVWDNMGKSGISNPVTIVVSPIPAKPIITRSGDVLMSDTAASWQWYKDGNIIAGATSRLLMIMELGAYTVTVRNSEGCENTSDEFVVNVLGIENPPLPDMSVSVHPEPNSGVVTITIETESFVRGRIYMYDMLGRLLYEGQPFEGAGLTQQHLDFFDVPSGMYLLRIDLGGKQLLRKITRR